MVRPLRVTSVRPLVRYVDEQQAVVDAHFYAAADLDAEHSHDQARPHRQAQVVVEIDGAQGFHDERDARLELAQGQGSVRFDIVCPDRWWPAGMGDQSLYQMKFTVLEDDEPADERDLTLGLTSVRQGGANERHTHSRTQTGLLVNGRIIDIDSLVVMDREDEGALLPASGASLILVRDHYGPPVLYNAADRAGILMIQCVPIDEAGLPVMSIESEIDRLAGHPSLAGYFVGHLGTQSDQTAQHIRALDPTRPVFRELPFDRAA